MPGCLSLATRSTPACARTLRVNSSTGGTETLSWAGSLSRGRRAQRLQDVVFGVTEQPWALVLQLRGMIAQSRGMHGF